MLTTLNDWRCIFLIAIDVRCGGLRVQFQTKLLNLRDTIKQVMADVINCRIMWNLTAREKAEDYEQHSTMFGIIAP